MLEHAARQRHRPDPAIHEHADRADRQQRRRLAVYALPARSAAPEELRRSALAGLIAGVHAQRIENRLSDRLPNLSSFPDSRHGSRRLLPHDDSAG